MNIAVLGWYHHRNAGDDRIQYCLTRWLDGHTLAFLPAGRKPPNSFLRTYDAIIIGGGGLLFKEGGIFKSMAEWVRNIKIPVCLVSVSIEGMTVDLKSELKDFLDVCSFSWFRDQGSLNELGNHPKAFVAPDISWLYPFPICKNSDPYISLSLKYHKNFPLKTWENWVSKNTYNFKSSPFYFENGGDNRLLKNILDKNSPEEFDIRTFQNSEAVISGRYHGILFALQSGKPVIGVGRLNKIERFMKEVGLREWLVDEDEPYKLEVLLMKIRANKDSYTKTILSLREKQCSLVKIQSERALQILMQDINLYKKSYHSLVNKIRSNFFDRF